jgi:hypothetical protein
MPGHFDRPCNNVTLRRGNDLLPTRSRFDSEHPALDGRRTAFDPSISGLQRAWTRCDVFSCRRLWGRHRTVRFWESDQRCAAVRGSPDRAKSALSAADTIVAIRIAVFTTPNLPFFRCCQTAELGDGTIALAECHGARFQEPCEMNAPPARDHLPARGRPPILFNHRDLRPRSPPV